MYQNLLNIRLLDTKSTHYKHYKNTYNKFENVPAIRYSNENEFFDQIKNKVLQGKAFSFACDSKAIVTKWYNLLYSMASIETQNKMILFTSETDEQLCDDWKDMIIFYSPKISTGVDITCLEQSEQYVYISGKSVSSIQLYQMATRTRNMKQLNYYSCATCHLSEYESFEDCQTKKIEEFNTNMLSLSSITLDETTSLDYNENIYFNIFTSNTYALDLFKTNSQHFFEQELKNAGFTLQNYGDSYGKLDGDIIAKMK